MGRKNKKQKFTWNFDDECTMLAFLEFRISRGESDRVRNIQAIVDHLEQKRAKRFTVSQVENKLNDIQSQAMRKPRRGTIFSEGLKVLTTLPHKENVSHLVQQLNDEFTADIVRREGGVETRSRSQGVTSSQKRLGKRYLSHVEIPESPSPRRTMPTATGDKTSRFLLSHREDTSPRINSKKFTDQNSCSASNRTLSPKQEEENDDELSLIPSPPKVRVVVPCSSDVSTDADEENLSSISRGERIARNQFLAPTAEPISHKDSSGTFANASSVTKIKYLEQEVRRLKDELARLKRDYDRFNSQTCLKDMSLETALRESQQKCVEYDDTVKCLKYALSEKSPAERKLLYQQERQIESLRRSLDETKQNAGFSRLSLEEHYVPKQEDIQRDINTIHHESKKILFSYDDNFTIKVPNLEYEGDLPALLRRVLGVNSSYSLRSYELGKFLQRIGLQAIICALAGAALCEWVFAADFESTIAQPSIILNMYRQYISSIDDGLALRNVDIAANKLLFGGEYYREHVIPARAKALASALSDALAPLLPMATKASFQNIEGFHTWGEELSVSVRREKRFTDIFKHALKLKGDLLASTGSFILLLYPRGTGFDKDSMIAETKYGDSAVISSKSQPIQACFFPAIYLHTLPRQGKVEYKLDIKSECAETSGLYLFSKAIVVVD